MVAKSRLPSITVAVTGGLGFIGSHLCRRLLHDGHKVVAVARSLPDNSRDEVRTVLEHVNFELIQSSIESPLDLQVDAIVNLASPASPLQHLANPTATIKTNVIGAINLLDLSKRTKARFIQVSTGEVYGNPSVWPQGESFIGATDNLGPRAAYVESKRLSETLVSAYASQFGVKGGIIRLFSTYGPGMVTTQGRVIPTLISAASRGAPLEITGDGNQLRSFCFVDDAVDGIVRALMHKLDTIGPWNIGDTRPTTLFDLAKLVLEITDSKSPIVFVPNVNQSPANLLPDTSKALSELGWRPSTNLREGLERTVKYLEP